MILEFINNNLPLIAENSPVLQVTVPMLLAIFCTLFRCPKTSFFIALIACLFCFINGIYLFEATANNNFISYHMGGWIPPFGIEYRIDRLNSFFILLVSFFALALMPYAYKSVADEIDNKKISVFYTLFLLCFTGLLGILSTNDIFNTYVFLEISSLTTYTLIALGRDRRALSSSFSYLILGTIGATFILIAIGILYIATGSLNLTDIANRISNLNGSDSKIIGAFAFLTIGIVLKTGLFPLHIWLTNAYTYSPSFVSSFLSATATKVSIYVFIRFIFLLFGYELSFEALHVGEILILFSIAAIIFASISAIYNLNIKRLLAFSSVAQMGYISLMVSIGTYSGLTASLIHIANHGLAKSLLFACAGAIFYRTRKVRLSDLSGVGKKMPITLLGIIVGGFSLIGMPLTPGFISKWYMVSALAQQDYYFLIVLVIIGSILAAIYIWKIIESLYFGNLSKENNNVTEAPLVLRISIILLVIANIYFGIFPELITNTAQEISKNILGL